MTAAHSVLPPSSADRRHQCPGSRGMELQFPESEDRAAAEEGELAHMVACAAVSGLGAENIPGATEEMLEGADLWWDTVHAWPDLVLESRVACGIIHEGCWGTPDARSYDSVRGIVRLGDYKFGHRYVDVRENWQLLYYAIGLVWCMGLRLPETIIELVIVQPRNYHPDGPVRTWRIKLGDLEKYIKEAQHVSLLSMDPDAHTKVGPECRDCLARHACPTLQRNIMVAQELVGKNVPFDLPPAAIAVELQVAQAILERLKARVSGLENEVLGRIKQGVNVPGWRTAQGQGRTKWSVPVEEVVSLGQMMGVDVSKPGAVTPKQAIKAGLSADLVAGYSTTPDGEIKLVPDTTDASRKAFGAN